MGAIQSDGIQEFNIFDGQNTFSTAKYEGNRGKVMNENQTSTFTTVDLNEKCLDSEVNSEISDDDEEINKVTVFIDGSCIGNGGQSAKGGYGVYFGDNHPWNGSFTIPAEGGPTNNKAELRAAMKAIQIGHENNVESLEINSDSKYVVLGVTQWSNQWIKKGWKNANGEAVKNKQEWEELLELTSNNKMAIKWNHVPAHSGIPGNEEADKLAVKGATQSINVVEEKSTNHACNSSKKNNSSNMEPKIIIVPKNTDKSNTRVGPMVL